VDRNGVQPTIVGALPPQLTALIRTNINVQDLTVQALVGEDREHIYHAAMMDPHTAAELDLDQIWTLVDDLLAAHEDLLPKWTRGRKKQRVA
jgi:alpha-galactosidase